MYKKVRPLFFVCNTPTHVGSGSELGVVDLPIQRERHTGFPKFEASSIKGALREAFEQRAAGVDEHIMIHRAFGFDEDAASSDDVKKEIPEDRRQFAGAVGFTDARLLLFPVKSMKGVFAWITCLRVLRQFEADMRLVNPAFTLKGINDNALSASSAYLFAPDASVNVGTHVILEEYTFKVENQLNGFVQVQGEQDVMDFPDWLAHQLFSDDGSYWSEKIKKDIVVLPDDDFKDFVNLSTEVITRTKIDNKTGTVKQGALFNEEYLPSESILYSLLLTTDEFKEDGILEEEVFSFFKATLPPVIQIGGNATLGKGIVGTKIVEL